ncbi:adenylate/guanylate cyclase domain-containing protein [Streptomyces sp. MI02-7b]|uniref:adenylate/guanylate cyclase domain-containing protein n=1 Tax=Streptomyces sp. MI02-7b TaxID=462941 RepID=UPI0029BE960E|nr:adenylate/guanylate cyclase domain-containing protein [Streptomyces sp. MI02-7b]MDX3074013.1 adenylate/guanylate cyclase domain-containing protein [Streptomyces sp. MI02-7b]
MSVPDSLAEPATKDCSDCGVRNPPAAQFCMACGTELARPETPGGLRFVSVVFCDVVGSTGLATTLEPDRWAAVLDGYFTRVGALVQEHAGKVEKFIGDAVVAVFGVDAHGESAAAAAVAAASAIVRGTRAYAAELGELLAGDFPVRAAVASGHVAVSARTSSFVIGSVLNRAARLQQYAPDDGVIVDLATRLQLPDDVPLHAVEPVAAKGFDQAVPAWVVGASGAAPRSGDGPVLGRDALLGELATALTTALELPAARPLIVDGAPGVGKSRLVAEALDRCPPHATALLTCPPAGSGLGLLACYLLQDELEQAAAAQSARVEVTAHVTGLSSRAERAVAQDRGELVRALGSALARFRGDRPLALVVERAEWMPDVLTDVLGELCVAGLPQTAVVLVGVTAPPALTGSAAHRLTVPPLAEQDARLLAQRLLTVRQDDAEDSTAGPGGTDTAAQIAARAGGNPLYIEQMVALRRYGQEGDDWVPPSAHAALGARLDRLAPQTRELLTLLSAAGRDLALEDLAALMPSAQVATAAAALVEAGLLAKAEARRGKLAPAYPVVAEVALRRMTLAETAAVHTRLARAVESVAERRPAVAELLAGHWEAVHTALRGVEPSAPSTTGAASAAVGALGAAARFALSRGRPELVLGLTERARRLTPDDSPATWDIDVLEAYALGSRGMPKEALERVGRVLAADPGRIPEAAGIHARLNALYAGTYVTGEAPAVSDDPHYLAAVGADSPEARAGAHLYAGLQALRSGDHPAAERELHAALRAADGAPQCLGRTEIYANLAMALVNGDTPVPAALADCERLHREVAGSRLLSSAIAVPLALVRHMAGDLAGAEATMDEAEESLRELGQGTGAAMIAGWRAVLAARAGDWTEAAHWSSVQGERCDALGMTQQARIARLHVELALAIGGEPLAVQDPATTAEPEDDPTRPWVEHAVVLQARAARSLAAGDRHTAAAYLDATLDHLSAVRGSGALISPLLCAASLARRTGLPVAERALGVLGELVDRKQDRGVRLPRPA